MYHEAKGVARVVPAAPAMATPAKRDWQKGAWGGGEGVAPRCVRRRASVATMQGPCSARVRVPPRTEMNERKIQFSIIGQRTLVSVYVGPCFNH